MDEPELNPYAPPQAPIGQTPELVGGDLAQAEAMRRTYLSHEASIKSIGSLHYLGAFFTILGLGGVVMTLSRGGMVMDASILTGALVYAVIIAFHVALGIGLSGLQTWARWVEVVVVGLSLLMMFAGMGMGFYMMSRGGPMGGPMIGPTIIYGIVALIPAYVLYLLLSQKGSVVFSPEYRVVMERTPHIKYQTSCLIWFLLVLIGGLILFAIVGTFVSRWH